MLTASLAGFEIRYQLKNPVFWVVAILFFVLFGDRRIRAYVLGGLVGIVALGVVLNAANVTLPAVFQKRVANALEAGDIAEAGTFEDRLGLAKDAWQRVGDHMFVGVGVDQDRVISPAGAPVHNMYLLLWVEGGFLALVGWIAMIGVGGVIGFTALKRDRLAGALALSVLATFLLFSAASPHMYARLWAVPVLLALAIALQRDTSGFTFYLLPTRAWELLCGAMLAVTPAPKQAVRPWLYQAVGLAGLAAVLVAVFTLLP